jgi:Skp family chaperone for outer membrane proteins
MATTVAVVDFEKIVRDSKRNAQYTQEWENGEEMKGLQAELENRRKALADYRASIGNAALYTEHQETRNIDGLFGGSSFGYGFGYKPEPRTITQTIRTNTAEGNRVAELERAISDWEGHLQNCRNGRAAINAPRIRNEVKDLVRTYATQQGIDLVLFQLETVFYMSDAADITPEILAIYDAV